MKVPEKLINFRVYKNGTDLIGIADVTLPSLEAMTETISGAGIGGEIDSPVMGHYSSMEVELNWRTLESTNIALAAPTAVNLDIRGAMQIYDSSEGAFVVRPVKVVVQGVPKTTEMGSLQVGNATDTKNTLEVSYIKITIDDSEVLEIDKYNFICTIDSTDYMEEIRDALGLS